MDKDTPQSNTDWREEFDFRYVIYSTHSVPMLDGRPDEVKSFISQLLEAERERTELVARDREARFWFETWYSHYISPEKPAGGEFSRFATDRIQETGHYRDAVLQKLS